MIALVEQRGLTTEDVLILGTPRLSLTAILLWSVFSPRVLPHSVALTNRSRLDQDTDSIRAICVVENSPERGEGTRKTFIPPDRVMFHSCSKSLWS